MIRSILTLILFIILIPSSAFSQVVFNSLDVKDLNVSQDIVVTSTTKSSKPCPAMTTTQRDAVASPATGSCVYNTTTLALNIYNGTIWKAAGGGIADWATSTVYAIGDVVIESVKIYQCAEAHTSGTFATDLAAVKWVQIAHNVTDAAGILPLANGGSNKNMTAINGGIVFTDADSQEVSAAGTSGQILESAGAATPVWVAKSVSGKSQYDSAVTATEFQVPNNQLTVTASGKYLVESGNKNILLNPSFEHTTATTSWTNDGTEVGVSETTTIIDGLKSLYFNPSSETINLTQSSTTYAANFSDGVQGLAMCRIKSSVALSMCAIQAGTVSTTDCVTTNTDSKWGLYKVPFILGATSNGVSIAGSSLTGAVYVDDCFVGAENITQNAVIIGPWTAYTPTFTGFGTVSTQDFQWRQVGSGIEIRGKWTSGTVTSTEARVSLPNGYISTANPTTLTAAGFLLFGLNGASSYWTLIEPSVSYLVFSRHSSTSNALTKANASSDFGSSLVFSLTASVPVTALSGAASTYSSQCGANCVDEFSAQVSVTGVTSAEEVDWINGNVALASSVFTGTFTAGIFTVAPNCHATTSSGGFTKDVDITSTSTTFVARTSTTTLGTAADSAFSVSCKKTGADFTASRLIQGSFKEVNVHTGINKPKTCHYAFGGSAATLASPVECTTGTCIEVYDSCGTATPPAWATTAIYTDLTWASGTWANSTYVKCDCSAYDTTSGSGRECTPYFATSDHTWASNSSGGFVANMYSYADTGTAVTAYFAITCTGAAP